MKTTQKKKVLVGMSGGVDSTVTACLLKEQGYEVIGIHLRFWVDPTIFSEEDIQKFPQNKCCTLDGLIKTRMLAKRLGIPFYVLNFEDIFKENVVDFFIEGYGKGVTPNPCIECNRKVKFGFFLQKMRELGADYVATGHYARKITIPQGVSERYELWTAKDMIKDQSYFLYTLTQEKLKHVLFPIGNYLKTEVRELAKKFGIEEVNQQKESQNLCFYPEQKPGRFLKRYLGEEAFQPGPIISIEGERLGTHSGLPHYTIGQRKGLGIGGIKGHENDPDKGWYVIQIDREHNSLIVGKKTDLYKKSLDVNTLSFIEGRIPDKISMQAKIRSLSPRYPGVFWGKSEKEETTGVVEFDQPQRAITPGQSVVFYEDEKVLGGGIIA